MTAPESRNLMQRVKYNLQILDLRHREKQVR